jgi:radical SAM enzyme (TIGR01210 family)
MQTSLQLRRQVMSLRGIRESVDPRKANGVWVEEEPYGQRVLTVLLTVNECPWRCAMCDLWKHTLRRPTLPGDVPRQIELALAGQSSELNTIKLYNSGSFFDLKSIPADDYRAIAQLCRPFQRVVVENHPRLCNDRVKEFKDLLQGRLEVALGVETLQTGMLRRLNKGMSRDCIDKAVEFLHTAGIDTRAFVMLRPPWTKDAEGVAWTLLTVRHLARLGVRHTSIIPARAGNGWMDELLRLGEFRPPSLAAIEATLAAVASLSQRGIVTFDLWNWPPPQACPVCAPERKERIEAFNVTQSLSSPIRCSVCSNDEENPCA